MMRPSRSITLFILTSVALVARSASFAASSDDAAAVLARLQKQVDALTAKADQQEKQIAELRARLAGRSTHPSVTAPSSSPSRSSSQAKTAPAGSTPSLTPSGTASSAGETDQSKIATTGTFDVPDSPSAEILGVAPQKVIRPSSPEALVPALINGVDKNGNVQSGLAIDFDPFTAPFTSWGSSLKNDPECYPERVLARTQFSLVTTRGSSTADESTKLAFGLQTTLMKDNSPAQSDEKIKSDSEDPIDPRQLGYAHDQLQPDKISGYHYNSSWLIGGAQALTSPDGSTSKFKSDGFGVFSTYSYGFEGVEHVLPDRWSTAMQKYSQALVQLSYRDHELVSSGTGSKTMSPENTYAATLRLRFGGANFNGSLLASLMDEKMRGSKYKPAHNIGFSVEKQLTNNMWLTASLGKDFNNANGKNPVVVLGGVKVGIGPQGPNPNDTSASSSSQSKANQ